MGAFISATPFSRGIEIIGWAADPETTSPLSVQIYIDNVWRYGVIAAAWSPSVPQPWTSRGYRTLPDQRFGATEPGDHRVCMVAGNQGDYDSMTDCTMVNIPK